MDQDILKQDKILLSNVTPAPRPFSGDKKPKKSYHPRKTAAQKKAEHEALQKRKARIIVRNLSFKSTEENLREHFGKYGKIVDLNLLKKSDGKLVGCAFVQYEQINQAAKAIHQLNGKELLDRTVTLDWAVNKKHYTKFERAKKELQIAANKKAILEKAAAAPPASVVDEVADDVSIKSEQNSEDEDEESDEDEDEKPDIKDDPDAEMDDELETKPKRQSNDLAEGCTVFIKNIPFDASEADFKKCVLQFGHIYYALLSKDPVSGHSKGTGFVKFRAKESADMCLQAGTEFKLLDQVLDPVVAVTRMDIKKKLDDVKNRNPADSRNLYLTKEGMITAGSKAAEDVSPGDMAKRLRLEQIKTQMLKDLNRFVSRERLTVHNIPPSYDSEKLRRVVQQHTKLKPSECRVMRENHPSPGVPEGKSKGFGFLAFKGHHDALMCLRRLNNNPNVFGKGNRPIVSFSLEDKSVHNIKQKRLQRSQEKNPTFQATKLRQERRLERRKEKREQRKLAKAKLTAGATTTDDSQTIAAVPAENKPSAKNLRRKEMKAKLKLKKLAKKAGKEAAVAPEPEFAGVLAEPGTGSARPRWKLTQQSQIHQEDISKKKKELKKEKEKRELNAEKKEVDRTKQRVKSGNEVDSFSFMVDKYRKLIDSNSGAGGKAKKAKTKWYTE